MATPIAGNNNFTKVENLAGSLTNLNVTDAKVNSLDVQGRASVGLLEQRNSFPGRGSLRQVVGYAPVGFSTAVVDTIQWLNVQPNSPAATAVTSSQLLLLPVGAQIVSAMVTNNGVTVTNTVLSFYDVSSEVWSAVPAATGNIASGVPLASVNLGANVGGAATSSALGSSGTSNEAVLAAAVANTGVNVQTLLGDNLTGDFAVLLTYLL